MKLKKLIIGLDIIVVIAMILIAIFGRRVKFSTKDVNYDVNFSASGNYNFNLLASPEETRVKAGETVLVTLSLDEINMGKEGMNSIVGFLGYNEDLFESMEIYAGGPEELTKATNNNANTPWNVVLNRIKSHKLYGKFCIYTEQEGVTENQDVATLIFKLKDNLKPQTTKVTFKNLASSNGDVAVDEDDREVIIIIYEDEPTPDPEPTPEPDQEPTPDPEPIPPATDSPQTGDSKFIYIIITLVLTILLNIVAFGKMTKTKVISSIVTILLGLIAIGTVVFAADEINVQEVMQKLLYKETWLNSEKYLVTEENVSRIAPETSIGTCMNQFNKKIEIKYNNEIITKDYMFTGMKINVKNPSKIDAEGNREYNVSVVGDLDGNGLSNQVELTKIIRNTINSEKWKLEGINKLSADMAANGEINKEDIIASVNYIVFEELEIPSFKPVNTPSIEIVSGEFDEEKNCYVGNVQVKITENEENALRTQYKIENEKGEIVQYTEIERNQKNSDGKYEKIIEITNDDIFKISAYTNGNLGNRSEIEYIIVSKYESKVGTLTVHHYKKGTTEKVAEDEVIAINYGSKYKVTSLIPSTNYIEIDGSKYELTRTVLDENKYKLFSVESDSENTNVDETKAVTGKAFKGMKDIAYYYDVVTFKITGEVVGGNGRLVYIDDDNVTEILEEVEYGGSTQKTMIAKPDKGYIVDKIMLYTGEEIDGTYGNIEDGGIRIRARADANFNISIPKIKNVKKDDHIVVTFKKADKVVAKIIGVPTGAEEMTSEYDGQLINGHTYPTLESAIDDAERVNAVYPGKVEIILLADIDDEINKIGDERYNNVSINLNGYTISLNDGTQYPISVYGSSELTIINVMDEQTGKKDGVGTIINESGSAVDIKNNGIVTIGINNEIISEISPRIEGDKHGINQESDSSVLNFYDGIIVGGESSVGGSTQYDDVPIAHKVSTQGGNNQPQEAILKRNSDIEAVIGQQEYITIEEAFNAVNTNINYTENTPVEIDVVSLNDVTIEKAIVLNSNKNVILDLNGRTINKNTYTTTEDWEKYIFVNNGTLEIKDSSENVDEEQKYLTLQHEGEYYFEHKDNYLKPNNFGIKNSIARSFIEIDLSDKDEADTFELEVDIDAGNYYRYIKVYAIQENEETTIIQPTEKRYSYSTIKLNGGKKYKLYLEFKIGDIEIDARLEEKCGPKIYAIKLEGKSLLKNLIVFDGKIINSVYDNVILNNENASVLISAGEIESTAGKANVATIVNYGDFTMNGGTIFAKGHSPEIMLNYMEEKAIKINGGSIYASPDDFTATSNIIKNVNENAEIVISGGTRIIADIYGGNKITINDSVIKSKVYGINKIICNNSLIGQIDTKQHAQIDNSIISEISNEETTIVNNSIVLNQVENNKNVLFKDCELQGTVKNSGTEELIAKMELDNTTTLEGIWCKNSELNIYEGSHILSAIDNKENSIVNVGKKDGKLNVESPIIEGDISGNVNFYDGVLIGATCDFTEIEEKTIDGKSLDVVTSTIIHNNEEKNKIVLGEYDKVAKISKTQSGLELNNDVKYTTDDNYYYFNSLRDAVDVCPLSSDNSIEIILEKDIEIATKLECCEGKNIKININGHNIRMYNDLINNGKLEITNSEDTGEIYGKSSIQNNNELYIRNNVVKIINKNNLKIDGLTHKCGLENYGSLIVYSGDIGSLKNLGDGICTINGGTFNTVNNTGNAQLNIENGEIKYLSNSTEKENGLNIISGTIETLSSSKSISIIQLPDKQIKITKLIEMTTSSYNTEITELHMENITSECEIKAKLSIVTVENCTLNNLEAGDGANIKNSTINNVLLYDITDVNNLNSEISNSTITCLANETEGTTSVTNCTIGNLINAKIAVVSKTEITSTVSNSGELQLTSDEGTIVNSIINNSGTLDLGTDDDNVTEYPKVINSNGTYAILNSGVLNFYDGTVTASKNYKVTSEEPTITPISNNDGNMNFPEQYSLVETDPSYEDVDENTKMKSVTAKPGRETIVKVLSSEIDNLGTIENVLKGDYYEFYSISDAASASKSGATIILNRDIFYGTDKLIATIFNTVVIDLAGKSFTVSNENSIVNEGNLTIKNSQASGKMILNSNLALDNKGTLIMEGVTITASCNGTEDEYVIPMKNEGNLTYNMVDYQLTGKYITFLQNNGTANINDSEFSSEAMWSSSIRYYLFNKVVNTGTLNIANNTMTKIGIYNEDTGNIELTNNTITGTLVNNSTATVENNSKPAVTINGGTITVEENYSPACNNNGEFIIKETQGNATVINCKNNFINAENGVLQLEKGTITGVIENAGVFTMNAGVVNGKIENSGTVNVNAGELKLSTDKNVEGIINTGIFNFGSEGANKNPILDVQLRGYKNCGISTENGAFNFAEGTISITKSGDAFDSEIGGEITVVPEDTELTYNYLESKIEIKLCEENVASIGNNYYKTLKSAIEACDSTNKTVIKLEKNILKTGSYDWEINKNITLDLNGHEISNSNIERITGEITESLFKNNGEFEITNTSETESKILSYKECVVINNSKLKITNGIIAGPIISNKVGETPLVKISGGEILGNIYLNGSIVNITNNAIINEANLNESSQLTVDGENVVVSSITLERYDTVNILKVKEIGGINNNGTLTVKNGNVGRIISKHNSTISDRSTIRSILADKYGEVTIFDSIITEDISIDGGSTVRILDNVTVNTTNEKYGISIKHGTLQLGIKDNNVKTDNIKINGSQYGIKQDTLTDRKDNVINFYDGTVYGGTKAILLSGGFNNGQTPMTINTEDYYTVKYSDSERKAYLELIPTVNDKVEIDGGGTFNSIEAALKTIEEGEKQGTIKVIKTISVENSITIKSGLNVTLDLNGYTVNGQCTNPLIIVEQGAILTIVDNVADEANAGILLNELGIVIQNHGTLNIGNNDGTISTKLPTILGGTNVVENADTGIINFYDGKMYGNNGTITGNGAVNPAGGYSTTENDLKETINGIEYFVKYLINE